jgi:hypothetical protein
MNMRKLKYLILISLLIIACSQKSVSTDVSGNITNESKTNKVIRTSIDLPGNPNLEILGRAYGYLKGLQFNLELIKEKYPELELEVKKAEMEFGLSFGRAQERITLSLKNILANDYEKIEKEMMSKIISALSAQEISKDIALKYLNEVKYRAKGNIESPVLETLLIYQFIENPSKEYSSGFIKTYSTANHPKAKGSTINIKLPISWSQKEGDRPNVVQKFISENGEGQEIVMLLIRDLGPLKEYLDTPEKLREFFTENSLKELIPEGAEYISAQSISLDNQQGGQVIYRITQKSLDIPITMQCIHYITVQGSNMILLQCMVSIEEGENLNDRFNLFLPLFRHIAISLVLVDKY